MVVEYRNKVLTRLAGGNAYLGCYGLAATIFLLGILRDHLCVSSFLRTKNSRTDFMRDWGKLVILRLSRFNLRSLSSSIPNSKSSLLSASWWEASWSSARCGPLE